MNKMSHSFIQVWLVAIEILENDGGKVTIESKKVLVADFHKMLPVLDHFFGNSDILVWAAGMIVFPSLQKNCELSFDIFGNRG